MKPFSMLSIGLIALVISIGGSTRLAAQAIPPDPATPAPPAPEKQKGESADVRKISKLQQRVQMDDVDWQAITPAITKVITLSKQLRDLQDTKHGLLSMKPPKADRPVDPNRPAPEAPPAWLLDLTDKAAALKSASEDPTLRPAEVEARLEQFHSARAKAEQQVANDLEGARQELRQLVTARQELVLTLNGVLD